MADNFSVKNYLRENKLGSYRLLGENYVDLKPIGEAPIKPTNIYNPETNGWMDMVDGEKVGRMGNNWTVHYEHPGVLVWTIDGGNFSVYATPKWDGERGTPIELVNADAESLASTVIDQDEFGSFEEYAAALLPHVNKIYGTHRAELEGNAISEAFDSPGESEQDMIEKWLETSGEEYSDYDFDGVDTVTLYDGTGNVIKQLSFEDDIQTDDVDPETGIPFMDDSDDQDRFWDEASDTGFSKAVAGMKAAGFSKEEIMGFIESHWDSTGMFEGVDDEDDYGSDNPDDDYGPVGGDRIMGLGGDKISDAVQFLLDDGFDSEELIEWFTKLVHRLDFYSNN